MDGEPEQVHRRLAPPRPSLFILIVCSNRRDLRRFPLGRIRGSRGLLRSGAVETKAPGQVGGIGRRFRRRGKAIRWYEKSRMLHLVWLLIFNCFKVATTIICTACALRTDIASGPSARAVLSRPSRPLRLETPSFLAPMTASSTACAQRTGGRSGGPRCQRGEGAYWPLPHWRRVKTARWSLRWMESWQRYKNKLRSLFRGRRSLFFPQVSLASGSAVWSKSLGSPVFSSPCVGIAGESAIPNATFVATASGSVLCIGLVGNAEKKF